METRINSVRKRWSPSSGTKSLNIFDANGNTILHCGEVSVPEKDASILSSLLTSPRKEVYTVELLKTNYICIVNGAGHLIGRAGFNDVREIRIGDSSDDQRIEDQTGSEDKPNKHTAVKDKDKYKAVCVDILAAAAVSGLVVVVNGMSRDRKSISGLLDDMIRLLTEPNAHPIVSTHLSSENETRIVLQM